MKKKFFSALILTTVIAVSGAFCADKGAPNIAPQSLEAGRKVYSANCASCHGDKGDGNGVVGASLNPKPRNFISGKFKNGSDLDSIKKTIKNGMPGTLMSGYSHLSEKAQSDVAKYVLSFRRK